MWPTLQARNDVWTNPEPILYQFKAEPILNQFWTNLMAWSVRPPFGYGLHTYVRIRSHFGSAEPILNQKCLQGIHRQTDSWAPDLWSVSTYKWTDRQTDRQTDQSTMQLSQVGSITGMWDIPSSLRWKLQKLLFCMYSWETIIKNSGNSNNISKYTNPANGILDFC